jgi:hypothetical protein
MEPERQSETYAETHCLRSVEQVRRVTCVVVLCADSQHDIVYSTFDGHRTFVDLDIGLVSLPLTLNHSISLSLSLSLFLYLYLWFSREFISPTHLSRFSPWPSQGQTDVVLDFLRGIPQRRMPRARAPKSVAETGVPDDSASDDGLHSVTQASVSPREASLCSPSDVWCLLARATCKGLWSFMPFQSRPVSLRALGESIV